MFDFEIARIFYKLSAICGILEGSKYRSRSFYNAALAIDAYDSYVTRVYEEGDLRTIPYVGNGIEKRIIEICESRRLVELEELEDKYAIEDYSILLNHGISAKLVVKLFGHGICSASQLRELLDASMAPDWMNKSEVYKVRAFLKDYHESYGLYLLSYGRCVGEELADLARECGCRNVQIVGEVNQALDRIHDVEIVYNNCEAQFGDSFKKCLANETPRYRQTLFSKNFITGVGPLGLPFCIRPACCENKPQSNDWTQALRVIRGDLHAHTNWSDGIHSLEAVAACAEKLGYEYQAITDHSASMRMAHGMTELQALEQIKEIRTYNETHDLKLIAGIEVDILPDGTLDYSDAVLDQFDVVVAAIHTNFNQTQEVLMARLEKALSNPRVNILAHPTGRLLGRPGILFSARQPYNVDIDTLICTCRKYDVALEVNCFPERIDLCRECICKAVEAGVRISLGTDSHSIAHMSNMLYGAVNVFKANIPDAMLLNTYAYEELLAFFQAKKLRTLKQSASMLKKDFQHYFGSNDSISSGVITAVGIDLTGSEDKETGWAYLRGDEALCRRVKTDDEIIASIMDFSPTIVSIDSPLAYPRGRRSPHKDSADRKYGISRECERDLRHFGINVYPCLIDSMVGVTTRGMSLARELREMGYTVIESYPGAAQDILQMPRKGRTKEQLEYLKRGLTSFGITWSTEEDREITHDEADAITSALVGYFYLNNQYVALGNDEEDYLIVPRIQEELLNRQIIIGLSGGLAAGKTTIAKYLVFKYGFGYVDYGQSVEEMYSMRGKLSLQSSVEVVPENQDERSIIAEYAVARMEKFKSYVIDGIRDEKECTIFRNVLGGSFVFVYVDCSYGNRSRRRKNLHRVGVDETCFGELKDCSVEGGFELLSSMADVRIDNNGTYKRMREQADAMVKRCVLE